MGKKSAIQWTEATWNPFHGCKKVSQGCKFCYMYRDKERYKQDPTKVIRSKANFDAPLKWKEPKLIFTCSWSDWFIEEADAWRPELWEIIKKTPQHTYQILTKRPERIKQCLPLDWVGGYPNVWIGVSVEDQEAAELRIPILSDVPAAIRFLSIEPLIGPVDLFSESLKGKTWTPALGDDIVPMLRDSIDWIIVGGESGNETGKYQYRECKLEWIYQVVADCRVSSVPVFVKQFGTHLQKALGMKERHGGDIDEFPSALRIREFPKICQHKWASVAIANSDGDHYDICLNCGKENHNV